MTEELVKAIYEIKPEIDLLAWGLYKPILILLIPMLIFALAVRYELTVKGIFTAFLDNFR